MRFIGPVKFAGPKVVGNVRIPLATFETPLWPSANRGARVSRMCEGIKTFIVDERMTRSVLLRAPDAQSSLAVSRAIFERKAELETVVASSSRFARLLDLHVELVGNLMFLRVEISTGDAAGHNMATLAAERVQSWILEEFPIMNYEAISANYCTDKKNSAVNGILGRGRRVIAEMLVPSELCVSQLRATPEAITKIHVEKNLLGSILAGSVRSANAHFANLLLGIYLATGQDAANIVEGSQGFSHAETRPEGLYFSVTIPNIIVGTVGSGKELDFVQSNLGELGCLEERPVGENARRLAMVAAGVVLCGELSLLAAQTNPGELTRSHMALERR